jgi:predicted ribosomally synthesized peptide with nif11-like leader
MSTKKVEEFLNNVGEDETLQAELSKALESENDREAVTTLAKSKGYDFSSEELWAEIQKRQAELNEQEAGGELSDEELEAVAGGATPAVPYVIATIVGSVTSAGGGISVSKIKW